MAVLRAWASTSALLFSGILLPVAGQFLVLLTPQPGLSLAERRDGLVPTAALVGLVAATAALGGGLGLAALYVSVFGLLTLFVGVGGRAEWPIGRVVGGAILMEAALVLVLAAPFASGPGAALDTLRDSLEGGREQLVELYRAAGIEGEPIERLEGEEAHALVDAIVRLAPALGLIGLGSIALLNVIVVRWRQRRAGSPPIFGDLVSWKSPDGLVWVLIASGYALFAPLGEGRWIAGNVFLVVSAVYFLHGLAVLEFQFRRWGVRPWVKALGLTLLFLQWGLAAGIAVVGLADVWRDFRRERDEDPISEDD